MTDHATPQTDELRQQWSADPAGRKPRARGMITTTHAARLLGISPGRVRQLILLARMKGQRKIGRDWFVANPPVILPPGNAPTPRG